MIAIRGCCPTGWTVREYYALHNGASLSSAEQDGAVGTASAGIVGARSDGGGLRRRHYR